MIYSFTVQWSAGKEHRIADALSRAPYFPADPELEIRVATIVEASDPALDVVFAGVDDEYRELRNTILGGREFSPQLTSYRGFSDQMRVEAGLVLIGDRIVIPRPACRSVIEMLHLSHSGVTKTCAWARQLYAWPSQQFEPVASRFDSASFPMDSVSIDLFDLKGRSFVVMVDHFSGFPFAENLRTTTMVAVCEILLGWFREVGFPGSVTTDNGLQFRTPFTEFCVRFHINHMTSSPYNPRSNGLAEAAVKSIKGLLKKVDGGVLVAWSQFENRFTNRPPRYNLHTYRISHNQRITSSLIHNNPWLS